MWNGSSEPFAANAWTTSSYLTNEAFTGISEISWTTIIEAGPNWDYRRTRRSLGPPSLRKPGESFRFPKSADSISVMSVAPRKFPLPSSISLYAPAIGRFRKGTVRADYRFDPEECPTKSAEA
jgi:hypothetical protein